MQRTPALIDFVRAARILERATADVAVARTGGEAKVKVVKCSNCGRERQPSEPFTVIQLTDTSLVGLRALFTGEFLRAPCPASCGATLDFEPALVFVGTEPWVSYVSGGDAFDAAQYAQTFKEKLSEDRDPQAAQPDVQAFKTQDELAGGVRKYLARIAGAMTALNAANQKGELLEFIAANWHTITPRVLTASDVMTLVARVVNAKSDEERAKGAEFFALHASELSRIQALSWMGMCNARRMGSSAAGHFAKDLTRYVDQDVIFSDAPDQLAEVAKRQLADEEHDLFVAYCLLATLARIHAVSATTNPLRDEWTAAWMQLEFMRLDDNELVRKALDPLALDAKEVAGTLNHRTLFDAAAQMLNPLLGKDPETLKRIQPMFATIGEKAGYPALLSDLWKRGLRMSVPAWSTAEGAFEALLDLVNEGRVSRHGSDSELTLDEAAALFGRTLLSNGDVGGLTSVFEQTLALAADDEVRADVESWFGGALLKLHQEHRFLEHIGAVERPWEDALRDHVKGRLWTERANALRALGRLAETLHWRERVVPLYESERTSENYRLAIRSLSMAHRELGAPDRALELLLPLLDDKHARDRITVLDTAAATWGALGELAKARQALDEAISLAVGPDEHLRARFVAERASLVGQVSVETLLSSSKEAWSDPFALVSECAAWVNLQMSDHDLSDEAVERFADATRALGSTLQQPNGVLAPNLREVGYMVLAAAAELSGIPGADRLWGAAADAADSLGQTPHPMVVLALATSHYNQGDVPAGRSILAALPGALARSVERLKRIDVALGALETLESRFTALTDFLMQQNLGHDARVVAEFRRDPLRRASSSRLAAIESKVFLSGEAVSRVMAKDSVAVLEFLDVEDGLAAMLSWQPPKERARFTAIGWPDVDLSALRTKLLYKLQSWVRGRPGDPFAVQGWAEFREWIRGLLDEVLPAEGHLIVIEHEAFAGLPFHVAVAPERSCSYTSSWAALLSALETAASLKSLGIAMVPAFGDNPEVSATMQRVRTRCRDFVRARDLAYDEAVGVSCDRDAVFRLLRTSDVAFVACHGFLDEARHEVAWVLAHGGGLPGKSGSLVEADGKRITHVGWRELEQLDRTPSLVVSAACSSGRAVLAGLGERLGMFPSLAERGTRTLIAPAWDVDADLILPVAARALELCLSDAPGPAAAVRQASTEASATLPSWIAWALTVEGAWI